MKFMDMFKILGALLLFVALVSGYFYLKEKLGPDCEEYYQEQIDNYSKIIAEKDSIIENQNQVIVGANDSILILTNRIDTRNNSLDSLQQEYEDKIVNIPNWSVSEFTDYFLKRYDTE